MRRREFITLIGGTAIAYPLATRAQQVGKLPTVGFLGSDISAWRAWTAAFLEQLRALGWIEHSTIAIEYRWSEGRPERTAEIAKEFVRLKVDVIVAAGPAVAAVKRATSEIPIVFAIANDPVGEGLVASLARPGGNATGLSALSIDLAGKRLGLLRELFPSLHRLAVLFDADFLLAVKERHEVQAAARALGLEVVPLEIRRAEDIAPAFESLKAQADALYVVGDALTAANRMRIMIFALTARLPTISVTGEVVRYGALVSYGPDYSALFRRTAELVDKILHGTKPADIPVEQPAKFELVINLTTAKALGLTVPHNLLVLADEVIE